MTPPLLSESRTRYGVHRFSFPIASPQLFSRMGKTFINPFDDRPICFPHFNNGTGTYQAVSVDPDSQPGISVRYEGFGFGSGVSILTGLNYLQGDFTRSDPPGENPTLFLNTSYSKFVYIPDKNEVWVVSCTTLNADYFRSTLEDPANVGFWDDFYYKWRARIFDLDTYTYTDTDLGLAQRSITDYPGHPTLDKLTSGTLSSAWVVPGTGNTLGYANDNLYFGWGNKNFSTEGYNWLIINTTLRTGTIINGFSPASSVATQGWGVGGEGSDNNLYCAPVTATAHSNGFLKVDTSSVNSSDYASLGLSLPIYINGSSPGYKEYPAITDTGKVIFAPNAEDTVCIVDPASSPVGSTYSFGHYEPNGITINKSSGCSFELDGNVYVWPGTTTEFNVGATRYDYKSVLVFDPATLVANVRFFGTTNLTIAPSLGWAVDKHYNCYGFVENEGSSGRNMHAGGFRNMITGTNEPVDPYPYNTESLFASAKTGISGKHPVGMNFPFVLWDTRNYAGTNVMFNEGTGGRFWDANCWSGFGPTLLFGEKNVSSLNPDVFGGPLYDKSWVFIISFGPNNATYGQNFSFIEWYLGTFTAPFFNYWMYLSHDDRSAGPPITFRTAIQVDSLTNYAWLYRSELEPAASPALPAMPNSTVIITHDIQNGGQALWINGTKYGANRTYGVDSDTQGSFGIADRSVYITNTINRHRLYSFDMFKPNGVWNRPGDIVKGFALARGEPTEEEVAYWTTYWD